MLRGRLAPLALLAVLLVTGLGTPVAVAASRPAPAKAAPAPAPASSDPVAQARDAFARGDLAALTLLEEKSRHDPLAAMVTSWRITLQILRDDPALDPRTVSAFLEKHQGTGAAERVRRALAQRAAEKGMWPEARQQLEALLRHDPTSRCWLAHARLETAAKSPPQLAHEAVTLLAETAQPPEACLDYFRAAVSRGLLNETHLVERLIATAFERGEKGANGWQTLLSASQTLLPQALTLLQRARDNPDEVWQEASRLPPPFGPSLARAAFLAAARKGDPQAASWSTQLRGSPIWREPLEWQIRLALQREEWLTAWRLLEELTAVERSEANWRFWRAWVLKALGKGDAARVILTELAREDNFFALLAGELVGRPLTLTPEPDVAPAERPRVAQTPQLAAIRALATRGWTVDAQREVDLLAAHWSSPQRQHERRAAAAQLAADGRYDLAIRLLDRSGDLTAWTLRYPTPWRSEVVATALREGVDPAWAYGIMRQESRFRPDARSPSGALGLMQVMPATGTWVAKKRNELRFQPRQLLEPETNLRFGITYLRIMTEQLDGHPVLATGAYNAGPGRIGRLRQRLDLSADAALFDALLYIELLPIAETRDYIRKVLANTVIYSHRLGQPKRLSELLLPYGNAQPQLATISERLR